MTAFQWKRNHIKIKKFWLQNWVKTWSIPKYLLNNHLLFVALSVIFEKEWKLNLCQKKTKDKNVTLQLMHNSQESCLMAGYEKSSKESLKNYPVGQLHFVLEQSKCSLPPLLCLCYVNSYVFLLLKKEW